MMLQRKWEASVSGCGLCKQAQKERDCTCVSREHQKRVWQTLQRLQIIFKLKRTEEIPISCGTAVTEPHANTLQGVKFSRLHQSTGFLF